MVLDKRRVIILAKSAGFCYGVRRAVGMVEEALGNHRDVATLGPIIHNPHAVARLEKMGAKPIGRAEDAHQGQTVVVRSHGATKEEINRLHEKGARVVVATCPHVERIQRLVANARAGQAIVVVGDGKHPEIRAIVSYAPGRIYVVNSPQELALLPHMDKAMVVGQTTSKAAVWRDAVDILGGRILDMQAHKTICAATEARQTEAVDIAKRVDAMLVVGSKMSANTRKLVELCARHAATYAIQDASEIPVGKLTHARRVGITAGASTPDEIIKEVVTYMSELDNKTPEEMQGAEEATQEPMMDESSSFMAEFEKTLVSIKPGQVVVGTIVQITEDEVCVNIGYKSDGIIPKAELTTEGDPREQFKTGDEIEVEVVKVNDGEGNVLLSQRNILIMKNWDGLVQKYENNEYVQGMGKDVVKGGLICTVEGVRTFVPASQLAERYVEKIDQFIGQEMMLKIIEVDRSKRRLVASRKAVLIEESKKIKEELWEKLVVGETIHGIVRRLTDFGAFVDIGGMDGLIHVTDLSWGRVRHPSDVVKPNEEVDVQVLAVDRERERISLGLKQLQAKPWDNATMSYPVGSIVEGKVVRMVTFGAFVELEPGLDGLVHISQIANTRVNRVEDVLQAGQMVNVKVLDVNPEAKRISLSIREALDVDQPHDALDELPDDLSEAVLAASSEDSPAEEPVAQEPVVQEEPIAEEPAEQAAPALEETPAEAEANEEA